MLALVSRGATMLHAKRAIEALLADGTTFVHLPALEDHEALAAELALIGIEAAVVASSKVPDVKGLRERLHLSREQFADRYGLEVETIRNWETGKREPDMAARSYLRAIANEPKNVEKAYAPTPSLS